MIFDDMRLELKELLALVRQDQQYCAAVMSGKVEATGDTHAQHTIRASRIAELSDRYGLR